MCALVLNDRIILFPEHNFEITNEAELATLSYAPMIVLKNIYPFKLYGRFQNIKTTLH